MAHSDIDARILKLFIVDPDADSQEYPKNKNGKNQKNIISDLGLVPNNSKDKVKISRAINRLCEIDVIERRPNEIDVLGKFWAIKTDIESIRTIFKTYPNLRKALQSNWCILDVVYNEHAELLKCMIECEVNPLLYEIPPRTITRAIDAVRLNFKGRMNESATFFEKCLLYDSDELDTMLIRITANNDHIFSHKGSIMRLPRTFEVAYRACLVADSLDIFATTE